MFLSLLKSVISVLYVSMFFGLIGSAFLAFRQKGISAALKVLLIPFYVVKYILEMEETLPKKILSILVMGALVLFIFLQIVLIVLTPPV